MSVVDDFLEGLQEFLDFAGVHLELGVLRGIFWTFAIAATALLVYHSIRFSIRAGVTVFKFSKRQIDQKFWENPGKLKTLIAFVLLVIAYGFYSADQPRTLDEALIDLGREQLLGIMPLAILTQWILLCAFWILFGRIMGVPTSRLTGPITSTVVTTVIVTVLLIPFSIALVPLFTGDFGTALGGFGAFVGVMFVLVAISYIRAEPVHAAASAEAAPSAPPPGAGKRPPFWRYTIGTTIVGIVVSIIVFGFIALVVAFIFSAAGLSAPSVEGVVKGDLIAMSVFFLFMCFSFRSTSLDEVEVPPALFHFIDLSLVLAAGVIALAGLPDSPVTLGPVPVWLVAIGPSLLVGGMILATHLRRLRGSTPRWSTSLVTSLIAAIAVWPVTLLLTAAIAPLLDLAGVPEIPTF